MNQVSGKRVRQRQGRQSRRINTRLLWEGPIPLSMCSPCHRCVRTKKLHPRCVPRCRRHHRVLGMAMVLATAIVCVARTISQCVLCDVGRHRFQKTNHTTTCFIKTSWFVYVRVDVVLAFVCNLCNQESRIASRNLHKSRIGTRNHVIFVCNQDHFLCNLHKSRIATRSHQESLCGQSR